MLLSFCAVFPGMFELAEKQKRIIQDMTRNEQSRETLLKEIPQAAAVSSLYHLHKPYMGSGSPLSRVSPQSEHSSSSSFSNGFCSSEDGSPFQNRFPEAKYQLPNTHYADGLWLDQAANGSPHYRRNESEKLVNDFGLCENLMRMRVRDGQKNNGGSQMNGRFEGDPDGLGFWLGGSSSSVGNLPHNNEKYGPCEGSNRAPFGHPGVESSAFGVSGCFNNDVRYPLLGLQGGYEKGDSLGFLNRPNEYCSNSRWSENQRMDPLVEARNWDSRYILSQNNFCNRPLLDDAFIRSQQWGMDPKGGREVIDALSYSRLLHSKSGVSSENLLPLHSFPSENTNVVPNIWVPQSHVYMKDAEDVQHFRCEDNLIIQGKGVKYGINKGSNLTRSQKKSSHKEVMLKNLRGKGFKLENCSGHRQISENGGGLINSLAPKYLPVSYSLAKFQGRIYYMAKDQDDSRFLQTMFDEGTDLDVQIVFNEIIDHVGELMMDPFGNYLMQKLLEVCSEEQRMQIVLRVTEEAGQLVRISLNTFGTRVVQKLIERLRSRQEISLVKAALKPGLLDLIKDLNGNHVLQRCLQCLSDEDNRFIFYAAAKFCVDIATHRHGCCVLQRCIDHSTGQLREKLITQISRNGLLLAQDQFGNYVVQYVIELKDPCEIGNLLSQFKGHYVQLAVQKFSSHVVEKCLKHLIESRSQIVTELLSVPHFEQFLQDPFANYVIQSALAVTKGPLHANLVEALRPHSILRTSPYCKRIFSRNLLKK